jgi:hypothetical protein
MGLTEINKKNQTGGNMELLVAVLAGATLALLATKRTLTIKIQHENIYPEEEGNPYDEPDKKEENFYEDLNKTLEDISSVMGGSNEKA